MIRFFARPAVPDPEDLCLVSSPSVGAPLFRPGPEGWWVPRRALGSGGDPGLFLGEADGRALWSLVRSVPPGEEWTPLRALMAQADPGQRQAAVRAAELGAWLREHRFCGGCGSPTHRADDQTVLRCDECGTEAWPRVTPAVIMLVHRGDEVLLARHTRFTGPLHSCLAGFVEAGETLEAAVAREVAEEVGIEVGTPVYVGSQAWPFPHSLMTGFLVPWVSGEPVPDGHEIAEAGWFRKDALPLLPPPVSIARHLIRTFFEDQDL